MLLNLVLTSAELLIKDIKTRGTLDYTDHALVQFEILGRIFLAKSKIRALNFRRPNVRQFRNY